MRGREIDRGGAAKHWVIGTTLEPAKTSAAATPRAAAANEFRRNLIKPA